MRRIPPNGVRLVNLFVSLDEPFDLVGFVAGVDEVGLAEAVLFHCVWGYLL